VSGQTGAAGRGTKIAAKGMRRLRNFFFVPLS
jgi:hypothetical protein